MKNVIFRRKERGQYAILVAVQRSDGRKLVELEAARVSHTAHRGSTTIEREVERGDR